MRDFDSLSQKLSHILVALSAANCLALAFASPLVAPSEAVKGTYLGLDRNDYPGDQNMAALRQTFAFTGYWLNNPPGANRNTWKGNRKAT